MKSSPSSTGLLGILPCVAVILYSTDTDTTRSKVLLNSWMGFHGSPSRETLQSTFDLDLLDSQTVRLHLCRTGPGLFLQITFIINLVTITADDSFLPFQKLKPVTSCSGAFSSEVQFSRDGSVVCSSKEGYVCGHAPTASQYSLKIFSVYLFDWSEA